MAIFKRQTKHNELYLYMNGNLIYKRWIDTGISKVFDLMAYDKYTLTSIYDLAKEYSLSDLIIVDAEIRLKKAEDGGRKTGFISGYRPNHVFEYGKDGNFLRTFIGDIVFEGQYTIEPGETKVVTVRFLLHEHIEKYLYKGRIWWIHEGSRILGEVEIL